MSRLIHCPFCEEALRLPDNYNSDVFRCPHCRKQASLRHLDSDEQADSDLRVVQLSTNPLKRYLRWAGTRSVIFQSLLLGWTVFASLATLGLLMTSLMQTPKTREDENAQAAAVGMFSCCSCGGYCLVAIPLGIAAIATLETRKK